MAALTCGCESDSPDASGQDMFAPTGMRIHPIFTQLADLNHTGKPDGIEAQLEFQDQFGDPTKAAGRVVFELFQYQQAAPDPRGKRVTGPWVGSLATLDDQHARWNTTLRTYRFQLSYPQIRTDQSYVLAATFELPDGRHRFFDKIVLLGRPATGKKEGGDNGLFPSLRDTDTTSDSANSPGRPTSRSVQP